MVSITFEKKLDDILAGREPSEPTPEEAAVRLRQADADFRVAVRMAMHCLAGRLNGFKEWSDPQGEFLWFADDRYSTYVTLKMRPIPERVQRIDIDVLIQPNSGVDTVLYSRAYSIHPRNWDDIKEIAEGLTLGVATFYAKSRLTSPSC